MTTPPWLTLTTDFGADSPYLGALRGAILSVNPAARLVDITHSIAPQDVRAGALVLAQTVPYFPTGTIHLAVVDPGVGTARRMVCVAAAGHRFVAPDNGLLSRVAPQGTRQVAHELTNPAYWRTTVSQTFHGRDIMGPVAGHLSLGVSPAELGAVVTDLVQLDWPRPNVYPREVRGEVIQIDHFGNLITNIQQPDFAQTPLPASCQVELNQQPIATIPLRSTYGQAPLGTPLLLFGSSDHLELAIAGGNAAAHWAVDTGATLTLRW